ncbi:MAG: hypothetical protein R3250_01595 [Melioribacteraceae bacterium]|nr:hypothetical protein [Melioribacteraceae bacterium]
MNVNLIRYGSTEKVSLDMESQKRIVQIVSSIINESNEVVRLMVTEDRINSIKESEESIEIIFHSERVFESDNIGGEPIKKILFPLTGEFIRTSEDAIFTIFIGDDEYFSGPLRNNVSYQKLVELKNIIYSKIKN